MRSAHIGAGKGLKCRTVCSFSQALLSYLDYSRDATKFRLFSAGGRPVALRAEVLKECWRQNLSDAAVIAAGASPRLCRQPPLFDACASLLGHGIGAGQVIQRGARRPPQGEHNIA